MQQRSMRRVRIVAAVLCLSMLPVMAQAATYVVLPDGVIGETLAQAAAGDTVLVAPGTYAEEALVLPAGVLLSALEEEKPVIMASGGEQSLLICRDIAGARVQGIVFAGSDVPEYTGPMRGGAVRIVDADVQFLNCGFMGLKATYGGAVHTSGSPAPGFEGCIFQGNHSATSGGAICAVGADGLELEDCLFVGNTAPVSGAAVNASLLSRTHMSHCTVVESQGGSAALGVWASELMEIHNTIIASGDGAAWIGDGRNLLNVSCTDIQGNADGDWTGSLAGLVGVAGNFSEDPLFCGASNPGNPWTLNEGSPCSGLENPECGQIGAFAVGCSNGSGSEPVEDQDLVSNGLPTRTQLNGNHPNPFNPMTTISLDIRRPQNVTVEIFDLAGRRVRELYSGELEAGSHDLVWNGHDRQDLPVAAGVYFCRLQSEEVIDIQRMLLVK